MGGTTFKNVEEGETAAQAFSRAVAGAQFDYGHNGYTGTIAEKYEFTIVTETPLPLDKAKSLAEELIEDGDARIDDKWGPAGCIPIEGGKRFLFFGWASS